MDCFSCCWSLNVAIQINIIHPYNVLLCYDDQGKERALSGWLTRLCVVIDFLKCEKIRTF